ncbi:hypothetical protein AAES_11693 [Amazona aestiva]|uniref:Uncharacterized protein n=1 Tax=Amazona aestiva TaxID=12930 RepID=A0A0Q3U2F3_AMAAE|nr:hypothetical protein AAES_11693 [Amazona aestiva]
MLATELCLEWNNVLHYGLVWATEAPAWSYGHNIILVSTVDDRRTGAILEPLNRKIRRAQGWHKRRQSKENSVMSSEPQVKQKEQETS